jgi:hypothetical protein
VLFVVAAAACGRIGFEDVVDGTPRGYREAVLDDQPLAYWRLGDEGAIARDEIGGRDGKYLGAGCGVRAPGALVNDPDHAVRFDGIDCKIDVGDGFEFASRTPFSIELWYSATPGGDAFQALFARETRNSDPTDPIDGYALVRGTDDPVGVYFERVTGTELLATRPYGAPSRAFVHVVAVYDGAVSVLYIDGARFSSFPDNRSMGSSVATAFIGAVPDVRGDYNHVLGVIDELALYDRSLPAERILVHYQLGVGSR